MSTPTSSLSNSGGLPSFSADHLRGTWNLRSMQAHGYPAQDTPAGATYTLTFLDNRLSTRADCNVCNGTFWFSGRTLIAGPALACTRAACRTMEFENAYTRMLGGEGRTTLSGTTLLISSERGVLFFVR